MSMSPTDFMLLVGGIILVGFLADELFRRKYIPDSIILMALGMVLSHFLFSKANLLDFAGFMASIAVAIILYDTGLNLDLVDTLKESGPAFVLGTVSYFLSAGLFALTSHSLLGWDLTGLCSLERCWEERQRLLWLPSPPSYLSPPRLKLF